MEHVTDLTIPVKGKDVQYRVMFHEETYTFEPAVAGDNVPTINLRRNHNQWECADGNADEVTTQAIARLEKFLLSQHWGE